MVLTEAQLVTSVKVTQEVDSDGEEVQLCCQCGLPVGETAYRPEEKDQGVFSMGQPMSPRILKLRYACTIFLAI